MALILIKINFQSISEYLPYIKKYIKRFKLKCQKGVVRNFQAELRYMDTPEKSCIMYGNRLIL